jgi:hypothetical protein
MVDFIQQQGAGAGFVSKNNFEAHVFNGTSMVKITSPNYPAETVRGVVYLNGTYYVMTPSASIYGSNLNDPSGWSALNKIDALSEPDGAVCLARQNNLLVAFGQYSTEFFYDAANPTGSPLLPYTNAFLTVGCACANSVTNADDKIIFMSQTKQKGRAIQIMQGTNITKISTPHVERLLDSVGHGSTRGFFIRLYGHAFYLLVCPALKATLVCDIDKGSWAIWTSLFPLGGFGRRNVASVNGTATFVVASSTDPVYKSGVGDAIQINNKTYVIVSKDSTSITIKTNDVFVPNTIYQVNEFYETYYNVSSYAKAGELDLVLDSTTGFICAVTDNVFLDRDIPIKYQIRTPKLDGENNMTKFFL